MILAKQADLAERSHDQSTMQVVDPSYRSAKVLTSDRFMTDLSVADILDSIAALVCTSASSLTAVPDKARIMQLADHATQPDR